MIFIVSFIASIVFFFLGLLSGVYIAERDRRLNPPGEGLIDEEDRQRGGL